MLSVSPKQGPDGQVQLHASTVVINGRAVAITGPSGCGKSGFAFALMARGAQLLADDITWVEDASGVALARCPDALSGLIEARGIGILAAPAASPAPLTLIVDLGQTESARLPEPRHITLCDHDIRVLHTPGTPYFIDAVWHYMSFEPERSKDT